MEKHNKVYDTEHHKKSKTLSKSFYTKIYIILGIALIIFAFYNMYQTSSFNTLFDKKLAETKEAAKPAEIQLTIISTQSCEDCYDINAVVDMIESTRVNITTKKELDFSSPNAKSLISKYGIKKVPTVIVTGEIDKSRLLNTNLRQIGEEKKGAYILTKIEPPFVDAATGKVRGKISLIHLKKEDCQQCINMTLVIEQLAKAGFKFKEQKIVDIDSAEGKDLIAEYDIKKVPTIILDKEAEVYTTIIENWDNIGSREDKGDFIVREINPPYYDIKEQKVKGLVSITLLSDSSCNGCYDPGEFHNPVLQRMGVVLEEEKEIDVSSIEGKSLIDKYSIEKVPTIILTGDVSEYLPLVRAWDDVGTVESDEAYVFRKVEITGQPYKDLTTGKVVDPAAES